MTKTVLALLAVLALVSACETMEGLGRDTQKLGSTISNAASRNNQSNQQQNQNQPIQQQQNY